jgi:hypothetical protein
MSDRGFHRPEPERRRTPEEIAAEIKTIATALAATIRANPQLETLPSERYREVDEALEIAGRYLQWYDLPEENLMELKSHLLTVTLLNRRVEAFLRSLRN